MLIRPRKPLEERFWEKVEKGKENECWEWQGARSVGYGTIGSGGKNGNILKAHRVSWEIHNGKIPKGSHYGTTCILHRCDNPPCVNPNHLFLGTHKENMNDRDKKGRAADTRGNNNGSAKLTEEVVKILRALYKNRDITYVELGKEFGIHKVTVRKAVTGISWSNIN